MILYNQKQGTGPNRKGILKMKFRATKKQIMEGYYCYQVGYCDLYYLLYFKNPIAYTCGVYGWNSDIYEVGNVAIVTGYRPFGVHVPHELIKKYETYARDVVRGDDTPEKKKELVRKALEDFVIACRNLK